MFSPEMYQLLDFGGGRKLERFGDRLLDRPSPPANRIARQCNAAVWARANARYRRDSGERGSWSLTNDDSERWTIAHGAVTFELKQTPFGHIGLFVEQADNWDWIGALVRRAGRPLKVLNLFAYTGGSTLAAASAGAEVVHLDAAKTTVQWARRNAQLSGLADAPIRWITEDAVRFVRRELKRGNRYDAMIMDPPSYGKGPSRGQRWLATEDLSALVAMCGELMSSQSAFFLLTCHTDQLSAKNLATMLASAVGDQVANVERGSMAISSQGGRKLDSGVFARWEAK